MKKLLLLMSVLALSAGGLVTASHASPSPKPKTYLMYDSVDPAKIPKSAKIVASYVGSQVGYSRAKQQFPNAVVVSINETHGNSEAADIWAIEPGGMTIGETVNAIASGKARGAYGVQSDLDAVRRALTARGVSRSTYVLWLSGAGTQNYSSIPSQYDAHQFKAVPMKYDVSTVSANFVEVLKGRKSGSVNKVPNVSRYYIWTANGKYSKVNVASSSGFKEAQCNTKKIPNGKSATIPTPARKASNGNYVPIVIACITPPSSSDSYSFKFINKNTGKAEPEAVVVNETKNSCLYIHSMSTSDGRGVTKTFTRNENGTCQF